MAHIRVTRDVGASVVGWTLLVLWGVWQSWVHAGEVGFTVLIVVFFVVLVALQAWGWGD